MKFALVSGSGLGSGNDSGSGSTIILARGLAAVGHEVHLILDLNLERGQTPGAGTFEGLESVEVISKKRWPFGGMLGRCGKVARKLQQIAPEVVHFHAPAALLGSHWQRIRQGNRRHIPGALWLLSGVDAAEMNRSRRFAAPWVSVPRSVLEADFEQGGPALESYLALIDQHRRARRIRFDRAHPQPAPPPPHRRSQAHPLRALESQGDRIVQELRAATASASLS